VSNLDQMREVVVCHPSFIFQSKAHRLSLNHCVEPNWFRP
jgi:hypothetical protein